MQGLAHCFEKDDNGKLADRFVIEPISANSLEVRHGHGPPCWTKNTCVHCSRVLSCGELQFPLRNSIARLTSTLLQCMAAGGKTCFKEVKSMHLGEALSRDKSEFPEEWSAARFCDDFEFRAGACARTWARTHAQDNLMCGSRPAAWRCCCAAGCLPVSCASPALGPCCWGDQASRRAQG